MENVVHVEIDGESIGKVPVALAQGAYDIAFQYLGQPKTAVNIEKARFEISQLVKTYQQIIPKYMGTRIKEDNKMNIPGGMKDNLKRIFGAADPLNHIENMRVTESYDGIEVNLTLRVPRGFERFAVSSPLFCGHMVPFFDVDEGCIAEREPVQRRANEFIKPKRVFFNGHHTVIEWPDGEKTTVGLCPGESYDEYTGFCAAIVKKLFGSSREAKKFMDSVKIVQKKKDKKKKAERGDE